MKTTVPKEQLLFCKVINVISNSDILMTDHETKKEEQVCYIYIHISLNVNLSLTYINTFLSSIERLLKAWLLVLFMSWTESVYSCYEMLY